MKSGNFTRRVVLVSAAMLVAGTACLAPSGASSAAPGTRAVPTATASVGSPQGGPSQVERSRSTAPASPAPAASNGDWPKFHYDLGNSGYNPAETTLGVGNTPELTTLWVNAGLFNFSPPAVVNGVVYVGDDHGTFFALNASTGGTLWSTGFGDDAVFSSPAVVNGVVYLGKNCCVVALAASTGTVLWSSAAGGSGSSPAVVNGVVYIGASDGKVYALNAHTGAVVWTYTTHRSVGSSPAVVNGVVYVGSSDGNVYALNAHTGRKIWAYVTRYGVDSSPAVVNGVVYVGSDDGKVYALNASSGRLEWSYPIGRVVKSSPAVANGVVYVSALGGSMFALDASTGTKRWNTIFGGDSAAVANGVVYLPTFSGLTAVNATTGTPLWHSGPIATDSENFSTPAIAHGVVYVASQMNSLQYRAALWAFSLPGGPPTSPPPSPSRSHSPSPTATRTPTSGPPLANTGASVSRQGQLAVGLIMLGIVAIATSNLRLRRGRHH